MASTIKNGMDRLRKRNQRQRPVIQEHGVSHSHIQHGMQLNHGSFRTICRRTAAIFGRKWYNIRAKSRAKGRKAIRQLFAKKELLAVLPKGYEKISFFSFSCCSGGAGNYASLLVITPNVSVINDLIM